MNNRVGRPTPSPPPHLRLSYPVSDNILDAWVTPRWQNGRNMRSRKNGRKEVRQFRIGNQILSENTPELRELLQLAYEERLRPLCMCKELPVPMYIARLEGQYLVKRMPLSGRDHDPACPSYEPPYELSGLGPLIGNAIQIDATGKADLKLDFPLTKRGPRGSRGAPV